MNNEPATKQPTEQAPAVIAQQGEDGAFELVVTAGPGNSAGSEDRKESPVNHERSPRNGPTLGRWGLAGMAAVTIAALFILLPASERNREADPAPSGTPEEPSTTFRAWIVPTTSDRLDDVDVPSSVDPRLDEGEPVRRVAGVIYQGPDASAVDDDLDETGEPPAEPIGSSVRPAGRAVQSPQDADVFDPTIRAQLRAVPVDVPDRLPTLEMLDSAEEVEFLDEDHSLEDGDHLDEDDVLDDEDLDDEELELDLDGDWD
ncbi:MAG: hypothetical protein EA398_04405 [Deltaproteobacteria bacterium]|nr:MAG: hypothetical protein EA398_04405 [Deltaproteobacteria bacterium]